MARTPLASAGAGVRLVRYAATPVRLQITLALQFGEMMSAEFDYFYDARVPSLTIPTRVATSDEMFTLR